MALRVSIELHRCSLSASGSSKSGFPVFFSYSLKAASRIDLKSEGGADDYPGVDEDMVLAVTVR